ncbi:alpha-tocopherol transfer protein-like [Brevipalpus obovatus]|uniref:alpha-tocopherol transfer protein-like n=1 Tax=Brevipalpus obovatus TaxID=246614 RepID=UPI003D9E85D2
MCPGKGENSCSEKIDEFSLIVKSDEFLGKFFYPDWCLPFFYRICENDLEVAKNYLCQHISVVKSIPRLYKFPEKYLKILESGVHQVSKARTPAGRGLIIIQQKYWNPREMSLLDIYQFSTMEIFSEIMSDESLQRNGFEFIFDSRGTTFAQLWSIPLADFHDFSILSNHNQPQMVKFCHMVHANMFSRQGFNLMKGIMKKETRNSFRIYGHDLTEVYERIPKSCLPADLGGTFTDEYSIQDRAAKMESCRDSLEKFWNQFISE